ncbi:hypothetical protein HJG60_015501 [Phyllostomus discolor]|uniref:Uncharacterized protein n=1 Tax=Phyllostomus discolor TaxID=89673 RepID=A0A834DXV9_9CHIR|nr:hypothetical protein HJG60_015501 [Phyllostomus discolor]
MMKSRTWWPFNTTGRFSTEPARLSCRAVSCWSGSGTSMARSWAASGAASGRESWQLGEQNQSQRCTHVPPALWPSPVRNSSAST